VLQQQMMFGSSQELLDLNFILGCEGFLLQNRIVLEEFVPITKNFDACHLVCAETFMEMKTKATENQ
jgi:hypothetical protein